MVETSAGDAGLKLNSSETPAVPPPPRFVAAKLLDAIGGEMTDDPAYAKVVFTTIDGSRFECYADGVTLKGLADKFLAFAGHVLLATRGESMDLEVRPLSELHDDAPDEEIPPPPTPSEIAGALAKSDPAIPHAPEPTEATGWQEPDPQEEKAAAGVVGLPERFAALDAATKDFIESFHTKPDVFFASEFVRATVKKLIQNVDRGDARVREIAKRCGIDPAS
jgi:hypothetical protein